MDLNSITLLSFALGVILILAAIIGKEIKIAAIELPAVSGVLPRLVLSIIGIALIYFGIFNPLQLNAKESEPTAVANPPTSAPVSTVVVDTPTSAPTPTVVIDTPTSAPVPTVAVDTPTSAPVSTAVDNAASEFNGSYLLQTKFLEAENKCLEGNNVGGSMGGAAFMSDCANPSTGQIWKLVPAGDGYYLLQTRLSEAENKCLEGNNVGGSMGGAAFMNDCANPATGQMWKLVPAGDGYYLLQTRVSEAENKCLEGNNVGGDLGGASFMSDCANPAVGQVWKLVSVP